jgi:hypothetical protein
MRYVATQPVLALITSAIYDPAATGTAKPSFSSGNGSGNGNGDGSGSGNGNAGGSIPPGGVVGISSAKSESGERMTPTPYISGETSGQLAEMFEAEFCALRGSGINRRGAQCDRKG